MPSDHQQSTVRRQPPEVGQIFEAKGRGAPSLDRLYRALDAVADFKDEIEAHCYTELCNLANLDLRLVCYDLTSTYFEGEEKTSARFASKAFGYSRDHRGDRPQVVIGLLVTSDGIPIAHHVFAGNTADRSTLAEVMADLQARFGVGRIALVADRGLISEENLALVKANGFDHVLATRLHRDPAIASVLEAAARDEAVFVAVGDDGTKATEVIHESRRYVVVDSPRRHVRDDDAGPSSSLAPRTGSSHWRSACGRGVLSIPPRLAPQQTGSSETQGSPVAFRPRSPTGSSPGTTTRRPWTTRRISSRAAM